MQIKCASVSPHGLKRRVAVNMVSGAVCVVVRNVNDGVYRRIKKCRYVSYGCSCESLTSIGLAEEFA